MRIGIISMQRVPNYGSFLQAYGLKKILEDLGHEVFFLDYRQGKPAVPYSRREWLKNLFMNNPCVLYLNDYVKFFILGKKEFVYRYRLEYLKLLQIGYKRVYDKEADTVVIGSDEVFNCLQRGVNVGFSPMLFGQGVPARRIISYAASFGYTDYDSLEKYHVADKIRDYLNSFSAISVRDSNSKEIVAKLSGIEPAVHLDPVLIADYPVPEIKIPFDNYVVLYTYKSRKYSEEEKEQIRDFCAAHGKELISIGNAQKWIENRVSASPLELLAYIKNADYIITDTFHGSVMSVKYNKGFSVLVRPDNKQKLVDLLERVKMKNRIITDFSELDSRYSEPIDYAETNMIIEKEKINTQSYFDRYLN